MLARWPWLVLVAALAGCRCHNDPPSDPLQILPEQAVFVMWIDLGRLRRAEALAPLVGRSGDRAALDRAIGFDPARDLERVVVGAASRQRRLEFVAILVGKLQREQVLGALEARGRKLARRTRRGEQLYQDGSGTGPVLLFPARGTMVLVSEAWVEPVLERIAGGGRSLLQGSHPLARDIHTMRGSGHPAWVASRLAPATGEYLASRTGLAELRQLVAFEGSLAVGRRLQLQLTLAMDREESARSLQRRLPPLLQRGALPLRRVRVEGGPGRRLRLHLALDPQQLQGVLKGLTGKAQRSTVRPLRRKE